jgi:signal peptidase I
MAGIHEMYMKRIIGLPGETVAFVDGRVLINGEVLDEPYEKTACDWNRDPVKLGATEYFVVGDNRTMPIELHTFGKVERNRIVGKAIL